MVDYGQNKDFIKSIENVDQYPDIAGIKLHSILPILSLAHAPLFLGYLGFSVSLLIILFCFCYWAGKKEDQGQPITLQSQIIELKQRLPRQVRKAFLPRIAGIMPHQKVYRR